jgi:hypothetical protein
MVAVLALLACSVQEADAHPLKRPHASGFPILHDAFCRATGLRCRDAAPKLVNAGLQPNEECSIFTQGKTAREWDPNFGAYVVWICVCNDDECHWSRLRIEQSDRFPWPHAPKRGVKDWVRACDSIVCLPVLKWHSYRVKFKPATARTIALAARMAAAGR